MDILENHIRDTFRLSNFINFNCNLTNKADVRYITLHALSQTSQNFGFALILSRQLQNVEFCQKNVSTDIFAEDIPNITYNFKGFLRNAFFINFFVYVENHIRQLATHFETKPKEINVISIVQTFKKLTIEGKTPISLSERDVYVFEYYCFLRNTMHNAGFQTQENKKIEIIDNESIFGPQKFEMELDENSPNQFIMNEQFVLHEQIAKILMKINAKIPITDFIEHRFTATGFLK